MIVLIINGAPRSGKDTLIDTISERMGVKVKAYSSIDWIKQIATTMGWEGTKKSEDRDFLAALKNISSNYNNMPFKKIIENILQPVTEGKNYFCTCIREPAEIQKLKTWCNIMSFPCYTLLIRNHNAESDAKTIQNSADRHYLDYVYDKVFKNHTDLRSYKNQIHEFIKEIEEYHYATCM